ncbi:TaqI-like C-terminal specificity domain-containing protein [Lactobacillus porci]|uniref:site-specific DNA-methyltransferase (adenine-specific) n=2 Tax=Lactobacillus porci TaxID=2012477 RepID=A0A6A8MCY5_9LACO|nr:TaqI-like C-terminal specificity domain-containing protein [Lactobacillus porci]MST86407.1 hypothetical protein [Lactobacillus porci]
MSDYIEQNRTTASYSKEENWLILTPIEQSIRSKVESVGVPLKNWDISINFGVKTGYNKAFIISKEKREEILDSCLTIEEKEKTAELIRPILRGKDIKRFGYNFANIYLINSYNKYTDKEGVDHPSINIESYPAIKRHLDQYWDKIYKRQDQGDTPYNLRRCAYMDDFNKPKIMFSEIVQSPRFYFDEDKHFIPDVTAVIIYGKNTSSLKYLTDWLNSSIVGKIFKLFYSGGGLGDTGYRYKKKFLENLPIPPYSETKIENIDVIKDYKFTKKEVEWLLNH